MGCCPGAAGRTSARGRRRGGGGARGGPWRRLLHKIDQPAARRTRVRRTRGARAARNLGLQRMARRLSKAKGRAGKMREVVVAGCAHTSLSCSKMITNRMYGSMCGSRASEPSSRSRVGLHDTRTRGGYWCEQARALAVAGGRVVCLGAASTSTGTAQRLLPARLLICAACLLQRLPSCTHWPQGGLGGKTAQAMRFDFLLCSHARNPR